MPDIFFLLIVLMIGTFVLGLIALINSFRALSKIKKLSLKFKEEAGSFVKSSVKEIAKQPKSVKSPESDEFSITPVMEPLKAKQEKPILKAVDVSEAKIADTKKSSSSTLEQRIGTLWVLIAGVIVVIVAVGFFLKYAYDNQLVGPLGRVIITAVSGLIALVVGEVTRKRGYGVVAKAVSSMGFAILYAAVFSAYYFYGLLESTPAFAISIVITAMAMLYAVSLNEVLIAILSLIGGFLTPVIVSTNENTPVQLFIYVLIMGIGAMLCSYYRKWRAVNVVAFVGTFLLYTGWFEKFYRPSMHKAEGIPEQMAIAIGWLAVFFAVYLVMPLFHGLARKVKAQLEDVIGVVINAAVVFYYLWNILYGDHRPELAFAVVGLCIVHLVMMKVVIRRSGLDVNLRLSLLVMGLFFLTIAIPLYLRMYAVAVAWAIEGCILLIIGLRYRSIMTQVGALIAILLSLGRLLYHLPMHHAAFNFVINPAFATWVLVATVILICHILYRRTSAISASSSSIISQILYSAGLLVLTAAVMMEWCHHCDENIAHASNAYYIRGLTLMFAVPMLLLVTEPVCPKGLLCKWLAVPLAMSSAIFVLISQIESYREAFVIFVNFDFVIAILLVTCLFVCYRLLNRNLTFNKISTLFVLTGIFVLWILITEQIYLYWHNQNEYAEKITNWRSLANMYISIMWAIYAVVMMVVGFWQKEVALRYISLGLFVILLGKVFILDTSNIKNVYRIAAFLATGLTLVGVSYLYQFLRKKGYFETMLEQKTLNK